MNLVKFFVIAALLAMVTPTVASAEELDEMGAPEGVILLAFTCPPGYSPSPTGGCVPDNMPPTRPPPPCSPYPRCAQFPVSVGDVIGAVKNMNSRGLISNDGVAKALVSKLEAAEKKVDSGKDSTAVRILKAAIKHLEAQSDKHVTTEASRTLVGYINAVIKIIKA
ncbi:MAG: hypothetical protein V3W31_07555 [Thermodesulfobacteriota bacterium]